VPSFVFFLLFAAALSLVAAQCHPLCSWQCDSPICRADCRTRCQPPRCQRCYNVSGTVGNCEPLEPGQCSVSCPPNQCEAAQCPACETQCSPRICTSGAFGRAQPGCLVLCAETVCLWQCRKPWNCTRPSCQLQCEQQACPYTPPPFSPHAGAGGRFAPPLLLLLLLLPLPAVLYY